MATCEYCNQEMLTAKSCTFTMIEIDGKLYHRSTEHFDEPNGRCNDCGVEHGQVHHFGCDAERCPRCGGQMIGCDCADADLPMFLVKRETTPVAA